MRRLIIGYIVIAAISLMTLTGCAAPDRAQASASDKSLAGAIDCQMIRAAFNGAEKDLAQALWSCPTIERLCSGS